MVLHGSHIEHLPEAEENWHQQGGAQRLAKHYKLIEPLEYGGIYQKIAAAVSEAAQN